MPGQLHLHAIETDNLETACILTAWEMTKLSLYNQIHAFTSDAIREEYAKNYMAVYKAMSERSGGVNRS